MPYWESVPPPRPAPVVFRLPVVSDEPERLAEPLKSTAGNSAAPAMREVASACTTRATAAATSKFDVRDSSIRSVSSFERKPRHHTTDGSAASELRGPAL